MHEDLLNLLARRLCQGAYLATLRRQLFSCSFILAVFQAYDFIVNRVGYVTDIHKSQLNP